MAERVVCDIYEDSETVLRCAAGVGLLVCIGEGQVYR